MKGLLPNTPSEVIESVKHFVKFPNHIHFESVEEGFALIKALSTNEAGVSVSKNTEGFPVTTLIGRNGSFMISQHRDDFTVSYAPKGTVHP